VKRIKEELGDDVSAIFTQGCGANINGHPLQGGFVKAEEAGIKLGDAVLKSISESRKINSEKISLQSKHVMLPCQKLPSWWLNKRYRGNDNSIATLDKIKHGELSNLRFDINNIILGSQWCLVAMSHEIMCEYELWVDKVAPFDSTMVLGYTNGCESYVATDKELMLGEKGGYEAGSFPSWGISAKLGYQIHSPLAIGTEEIIKKSIKSLWTER
jgi:hypothetical protein